MAFSLMVGIGAGFYYGNKTDSSKTIEVANTKNEVANTVQNTGLDARKKALVLQKLDLLKYYTNFVLLPKEKFADPKKYGEDMSALVVEINDNEITSRYNATAEANNDEQKIDNIRNLLNYLSESIQADLQ